MRCDGNAEDHTLKSGKEKAPWSELVSFPAAVPRARDPSLRLKSGYARDDAVSWADTITRTEPELSVTVDFCSK